MCFLPLGRLLFGSCPGPRPSLRAFQRRQVPQCGKRRLSDRTAFQIKCTPRPPYHRPPSVRSLTALTLNSGSMICRGPFRRVSASLFRGVGRKGHTRGVGRGDPALAWVCGGFLFPGCALSIPHRASAPFPPGPQVFPTAHIRLSQLVARTWDQLRPPCRRAERLCNDNIHLGIRSADLLRRSRVVKRSERNLPIFVVL